MNAQSTQRTLADRITEALEVEKQRQEGQPLGELIALALHEAREGNLVGRVYRALNELHRFHYSIYGESNSVEHNMAKGMNSHEARQYAEIAEGHGDRSTELLDLVIEIDRVDPA